MEQLTITDCGVSRLVDVWNISLDACLALLHILNLALSKTKNKQISVVYKIAKFNEARSASKEGKLSFEKV